MKILVKPYWKREDGYAATTVAIIMGTIAAAGAAVSAVGQYSAAQSKSAADKYNAQVSDNNALMAQQQSASDAEKVRERGRRLAGTQRAALSAAGVDPDAGSSIDVGYDSSISNELDRLTTLYKGDVSSTNSLAQAQLDRYYSKETMKAGYLNTGSTLLSGAAQSYMTYSTIKNNPRFSSASEP